METRFQCTTCKIEMVRPSIVTLAKCPMCKQRMVAIGGSIRKAEPVIIPGGSTVVPAGNLANKKQEAENADIKQKLMYLEELRKLWEVDVNGRKALEIRMTRVLDSIEKDLGVNNRSVENNHSLLYTDEGPYMVIY